MEQTNGNLENKVEHILIDKVKLIYGIVGVTITILFFFGTIELSVLKTRAALNEHQSVQIETDKATNQILDLIRQGDLKDLKADLIENRAEIDSLKSEVVKLQTIISERIPKK